MCTREVILTELMEKFHLSEHQCNQVISSALVSAISSSYCEKWRLLYSHLQLEQIVVSDSEYNHVQEVDKRHAFFTEWKERKGSEATYKKLLLALLKTGRRQDAEGVCRLLAANLSASFRPSSPSLPAHSTPSPLPSRSSPTPTTLPSFSPIESPVSPSIKFPCLDLVSKEEKDMFEARLLQDSKDMKQKFSLLLDKVNSQLKEKEVNVSNLKFLVKHSFCKVYKAVRRCKDINELMLKLSDYWSFFDYEMLDVIVAIHCHSLTSDMEKYKEDFKLYCFRRIYKMPEDVFRNKAQDIDCLFLICDDIFSYKKSQLWDVKVLTTRLSYFLGIKLVLLSPFHRVDSNSREYFSVSDLQRKSVDEETTGKQTYDAVEKPGDSDTEYLEYCANIEKHLKSSGAIDQFLAHLVFVGLPASGKTTLIARLLNLKIIMEASSSTGVMDDIITVSIGEDGATMHAANVDEQTSENTCVWHEVDFDLSCLRQMGMLSVDQPSEDIDHGMTTSHEKVAAEVAANDASLTSQPHDHTTTIVHKPVKTMKTPILLKAIESILQEKGYSAENFSKIRPFLKNKTTLYLSDTGGQIEFQELLPLLVAGYVIFLFLFPLNKDLDKPVCVSYRKRDGSAINDYTSTLTVASLSALT